MKLGVKDGGFELHWTGRNVRLNWQMSEYLNGATS
jgi:hypothetical protein